MRLNAIELCERGWIPDVLARAGMRRLMRDRLASEQADAATLHARHVRLVEELSTSPIAIDTDAANEQHYEVPAAFFHAHLGPRLKYSCCLYPTGRETLAEAEEAMLALYAERADLRDGLRILDLGCGWGSLSIWLAQRFPNATIVALSNSNGQREFIEARLHALGLRNVTVLTGNVAEVDFPYRDVAAGFDRVVSIEMLEHMKNYAQLFEKIARWLAPGGTLFAHVFAHRQLAYHFVDRDQSDWMTRYFFTGGIMPSYDLLPAFDQHLRLQERWWVDGTHYQRTAEHWLHHLDDARARAMPILAEGYGEGSAALWFQRWRMFYMAVAELFGYAGGSEWGVAHYRFERR